MGLAQQKITLVGLGSQGKAWASNLMDQGFKVSTFLRKDSPSLSVAKSLNMEIVSNFKNSNLILLLIPDHAHIDFFQDHAKDIPSGTQIIYGHGASLCEHHWNKVYPQFHHLLLAPKAIASELRAQFQSHGKLGAVYSIEFVSESQKEETRNLVLEVAKNIGITSGPYEVTFAQETYADLLSEQSLLCGLIPYAAKKCFDFLISKGIPPELAYMEAWHEVKLIGNAMDKLGPEHFFNLISPHAFAGAIKAKDKLLPESFDHALEDLYQDIQSGKFFSEGHQPESHNQKVKEKKIWKESALQKTFEELKETLT